MVNPCVPLISLRKLTKNYGRFRALHRVDLDIASGTLLAIFGPNGAGKSTLLSIISGLVQPSQGVVLIDDVDIFRQPDGFQGQQIGVLSFDTYLYEELTVMENLRFYGNLYQVENPHEQIGEILNTVGMEGRVESPVGTLSQGMRQRVALARTLLHDPDILLLDEPYSGLDQDALVMLRMVLTERNKTVLLVTHDLPRGLELADRVAILNRGRLVFDSDVADLEIDEFGQIYREHAL